MSRARATIRASTDLPSCVVGALPDASNCARSRGPGQPLLRRVERLIDDCNLGLVDRRLAKEPECSRTERRRSKGRGFTDVVMHGVDWRAMPAARLTTTSCDRTYNSSMPSPPSDRSRVRSAAPSARAQTAGVHDRRSRGDANGGLDEGDQGCPRTEAVDPLDIVRRLIFGIRSRRAAAPTASMSRRASSDPARLMRTQPRYSAGPSRPALDGRLVRFRDSVLEVQNSSRCRTNRESRHASIVARCV